MDDIKQSLAEEEEYRKSKELFIFGRDVAKIPCFRESFLYGISGGIGVGFLTFMATSKPRLGMHFSMATFTTTTLVYYFQCRYRFSQQKFEFSKLQEAMKNKAVYEGTDLERTINESARTV